MKYKIAVVGATGLVGRTVIKVLNEKQLPVKEYVLYASKKSEGKTFTISDKEYKVRELKEENIDEDIDFAIFSAGAKISEKYAPIFASKGCIVVDNSSFFRMKKDVPLVVPEVNFEDALNNNGIIANPNCSTIEAMLPLKALDDKYGIKRVIYSTYQACSGAGRGGLTDLTERSKDNNLIKFPHQIFDNCLPQIDVFLENGYTKEEMKMIEETRKILHKPDLKVTATTVRVPVTNSHSESINIELEKSFDIEDVKKTLSNFPNLILEDNIKNNIYPMAINSNGHDEVFVGRVRRDESIENGINIWVVADNIRKGAASNAVQIVEKLIQNKN